MVRFIHDDRVFKATATPLQVIAAGLPRAATSSMQAALEQLGYTPCMHMANIAPHADRMQLMYDAIEEKDTAKRQKMIQTLVEGHAGICDFPVCFFTPDLMDMYPDVKIVLNGRDAEVWAKSAWDSLGFLFTWKYWLVGLPFKTGRIWYQLNMLCTRFWGKKFDVDNIFTAECYEKYYQYIRDEADQRGVKVLEFRPEQGWEPLCKFLNKDVPKGEFPRLNEKKAFTIIEAIMVARGLLAYAAMGAGLWATWRYGPGAMEWMRGWMS